MTALGEDVYIRPMRYLPAKNIPVFAILLSGALLCGAWFFQYVLGYTPCTMCYWQRHAHKAVLAVAIIVLALTMMGRSYPRFFAFLCGLALLVSFGIALWHMGVEYKWWEGPAECAASGDVFDTTGKTYEEILAEMNKAKPPACSDSPWPNSPISMAGLNALFSLFGALVCLVAARRQQNV